VLENGEFKASERGTGQAAVISPLLANIYLHYAFDLSVPTGKRGGVAGSGDRPFTNLFASPDDLRALRRVIACSLIILSPDSAGKTSGLDTAAPTGRYSVSKRP
jgi:hypothetical protein